MKKMQKLIYRIISRMSMCCLVPRRIRVALLACSGIRVAHDTVLSYGIDFADPKVEIGNGSLINKGCKLYVGENHDARIIIGNRVYIAAGGVVTKDCEENCLYAGVPAKMKRRL